MPVPGPTQTQQHLLHNLTSATTFADPRHQYPKVLLKRLPPRNHIARVCVPQSGDNTLELLYYSVWYGIGRSTHTDVDVILGTTVQQQYSSVALAWPACPIYAVLLTSIYYVCFCDTKSNVVPGCALIQTPGNLKFGYHGVLSLYCCRCHVLPPSMIP